MHQRGHPTLHLESEERKMQVNIRVDLQFLDML